MMVLKMKVKILQRRNFKKNNQRILQVGTRMRIRKTWSKFKLTKNKMAKKINKQITKMD